MDDSEAGSTLPGDFNLSPASSPIPSDAFRHKGVGFANNVDNAYSEVVDGIVYNHRAANNIGVGSGSGLVGSLGFIIGGGGGSVTSSYKTEGSKLSDNTTATAKKIKDNRVGGSGQQTPGPPLVIDMLAHKGSASSGQPGSGKRNPFRTDDSNTQQQQPQKSKSVHLIPSVHSGSKIAQGGLGVIGNSGISGGGGGGANTVGGLRISKSSATLLPGVPPTTVTVGMNGVLPAVDSSGSGLGADRRTLSREATSPGTGARRTRGALNQQQHQQHQQTGVNGDGRVQSPISTQTLRNMQKELLR
jgi:hypothetical protein